MDETAVIIEMEDSFQCWITDETGKRELLFEVSKTTWNDDDKRRTFLVQRIFAETSELLEMMKHGS
jgi:hypothetical protein